MSSPNIRMRGIALHLVAQAVVDALEHRLGLLCAILDPRLDREAIRRGIDVGREHEARRPMSSGGCELRQRFVAGARARGRRSLVERAEPGLVDHALLDQEARERAAGSPLRLGVALGLACGTWISSSDIECE